MAPKRRASAAKAAPKDPAAQSEDAQPPKRSKKQAGSSGPAKAAPAAAAADDSSEQQQRGGAPSFFLMKSEPDVFSIDDLAARPNQTEPWDGVRSHQAKKVLQAMRAGDRALFYHSNAKPPGVVGVVEVVREAYPDPSQFDPKSKYFDASSKREAPKWCCVDVRLVRKLGRLIPLEELKSHSGGGLQGMHLFKYGRLSVQHVAPAEWEFVMGLEGAGGE